MPQFTPTRPPATRLLIPLPPDLQAADRALTKALASRPHRTVAARITMRALDLAIPAKAQALAGYLGTLAPHQTAAVVARNTLERAAAIAYASQAGTRPTADAAQWRRRGGTLILTASPEMPL